MSGFTLIELVVVITILGILAAFAVPKFIALDSQARIATINGLAGSVKSAASLARGLAMATGAQHHRHRGDGRRDRSRLSTTIRIGSATGIANAVNSNTARPAATSPSPPAPATTPAIWTKVGAPAPTACAGDLHPGDGGRLDAHRHRRDHGLLTQP